MPETFIANTSGLDYELLDSGNQRKLERFGNILLNRPEVTAKWKCRLEKSEWEKADFYFFEERGKKGEWKTLNSEANIDKWRIKYHKLYFSLNLTKFKHVGIFPEQAENWNFVYKKVIAKKKPPFKLLNLFAYTSAVSVAAAKAGAKVTNVDSVKQVVNWGRQNAEINEVDSIRWIVEDARKFVEKSVRRGDKYDGIIMDPPTYGIGSKKEKWDIYMHLNPLLEDVCNLLAEDASFFIINTYSPKIYNQPLLLNISSKLKQFNKVESFSLGVANANTKLPLSNLIRFH